MSTEKGGTNTSKDVIYIDIDDEITGIIDKVRASDKKILALVLPKRATVLQSIVNMKLLKRTADDTKKRLVLITSEAGLLPLAGSTGLYVARSLNTKPEIPEAPSREDDSHTETIDEPDDYDQPLDKSRPVGELAGAPAAADEETIELGDEADEDEEGGEPGVVHQQPTAGYAPDKGGKKGKKPFKIPNFNKFRLWLLLGGVLLVGLAILGYVAFAVMPKAMITIKTNSTAVNSDKVLTLSTDPSTTLDAAKGIVPAQVQDQKKTLTAQVAASGQQNNGTKASGQVTLSLTDCSASQVTIPAGTGVSASGKTFITKETASLQSVQIGSKCQNSSFPSYSTQKVDVVAQTGGAAYNIAPSTFTVAGYTNVTGQSSSAMTGGTDDIVKIVTQNDIDSAEQKIGQQDTTAIKQTLKSALTGRGLYAIDATFNAGAPQTTVSAQANTPADNVTVTQVIDYTMLGVNQSDLEKVIKQDVSSKINTAKQNIIDYGLSQAVFGLQASDASSGGATVSIQTTVVAGAELHAADIKKQVAGMKAGDARDLIRKNPGVTDVTVNCSPFWVGSIPKKTSKITVVIEAPQAAANNGPTTP